MPHLICTPFLIWDVCLTFDSDIAGFGGGSAPRQRRTRGVVRAALLCGASQLLMQLEGLLSTMLLLLSKALGTLVII